MNRSDALTELSRRISDIDRPHPVRVAVDGVDAAGKTILADELARRLHLSGERVIRASIDGFHNPIETRRRRGSESPEGYYQDSFDYEALLRMLLVPLGPEGNLLYSNSAYDFHSESATPSSLRRALPDSILIFDGVFLLRPELIGFWDFKVFVHADFDIILRRAVQRDQGLFGSSEQVESRYRTRYIPGQQIYLERCNPQSLADVVVNNNTPDQPELLFPIR